MTKYDNNVFKVYLISFTEVSEFCGCGNVII